MKLAIERSGGFDIIESADVERIEVENHGVRIYMTDGADTFAERAGHAESVATAAAIAAKCGALVEPLSEAPEPVQAGQWVDGEPPRDGRWYAYVEDGRFPACVRWCSDSWRDWHGRRVVVSEGGRFTPIPER